jgi:hypothetical protein
MGEHADPDLHVKNEGTRGNQVCVSERGQSS